MELSGMSQIKRFYGESPLRVAFTMVDIIKDSHRWDDEPTFTLHSRYGDIKTNRSLFLDYNIYTLDFLFPLERDGGRAGRSAFNGLHATNGRKNWHIPFLDHVIKVNEAQYQWRWVMDALSGRLVRSDNPSYFAVYPGKFTRLYVEHPVEIVTNKAGRLHNPYGPSVEWKDGFQVFHLDGWPVPRLTKAGPHWKDIFRASNVEGRRELMKLVDEDVFIKQSDAELIDDDPEYGKLYRARWRRTITLVRLENHTLNADGSRDVYWHEPPDVWTPTGFEAPQTARQAVLSMWGVNGADFYGFKKRA